jgi:D-glycero-alpha-D-manno-heptose-7-phosphate kinase
MRGHAYELQALMSNGGVHTDEFGRILDASWRLKRQLASAVTNRKIDDWYERALGAGALGGKILGAGGGGFLLFIVPPDRQDAVRRALTGLIEVSVGYEVHGSRVLPTGGHVT